jgi:hypothetical protein
MEFSARFTFKKQEFVSYTVFYCYDHHYHALDVIIHDPCNIAALLDLRCTRSLNVSYEDAFSGISAEQLKDSHFNEFYHAVNAFNNKWENNRSRIIAAGIELLNDKMNNQRSIN